MRPVYGTDDRPLHDLTARARIRDAALEQFAEHGFERATIRSIARAAGVSPGLVQHHFGSKEALRAACDDAVLDLVRRKLRATQEGELTDPGFLAALYASAPPLIRYVARAVFDGSAAGAALLDEMAVGSEEFLSRTWPERFPAGSPRTRDAAAVLVAQTVGTLVLHEHVARQMGLDPGQDIVSPAIGLAQLDVYEAIGEYVSSGLGDRIRDAATGYASQSDRKAEG
jgi:AcrR family transcriptional regulator